MLHYQCLFIIAHNFYLFTALYFFHLWPFLWDPFPSAQRRSFCVYVSTDLIVTNSFDVFMSESVLILILFLSTIFCWISNCGYTILKDNFLLLTLTLHYICWNVSCQFFGFYFKSFFLATSIIICFLGLEDFYYNVCRDRFLNVYLARSA